MKRSPPECLVDREAVRLRNEVRPFSEQELMGDNPDVGIVSSLLLIAADDVGLALLILVLAGARGDSTQRICDQRDAIKFPAHLLSRLLRIVGLTPAIDPTCEAVVG